MSKHTPGPWFVASEGSYKVASVTSTTGVYADTLPEAAQIAADARLIAAAPELLEALKLAQSIIGHPDDAHSQHIAAVIAKATGEKT